MKHMMIRLVLSTGILVIGGWGLMTGVVFLQKNIEERAHKQFVEQELQTIILKRQEEYTAPSENIFGDDGRLSLLLIGLDTRADTRAPHCDAIQLIEIDTQKEQITITAVPRGTYAPLPGGTHEANQYYVSNACAIGGIDYGIEQIENILGKQTDAVAFVGFSEALGIFRLLDLPATETLQWLRHRHGYAIGEPQRARNHSTFLKQMMIRFVPENTDSSVDTALYYVLYRMVQTDLSFDHIRQIIAAVSKINITEHPDRIRLAMKPAYEVQDIVYDESMISDELSKKLLPVVSWLDEGDYQGLDTKTIEERLIMVIDAEINNQEFISWAYANDIWLQLSDPEMQASRQFEIVERYIASVSDIQEAQMLWADYILEMAQRGLPLWEEQGKERLRKRLE